MDTVFIRGLTVHTVIGIHGWEQQAPRPLLLDLELGMDTREAAASDHIRDALDYHAVSEDVQQYARDTRVQLLETFAERLARRLFERYPVQTLRLRVDKPGAVPGVAAVGVDIQRERQDYAVCGR